MADSRPNIIMIMTDQQRFDTIAGLGSQAAITPNLDKMVKEGVSFDRCYVTGATCVPSRASLFTGAYPHTNGVMRNTDKWSETWVRLLKDSGYHCVNIGKMHTLPYEAEAGFNERYVVENKDRFLNDRYYFDEWDKALAAHGLKKQQRENYRQLNDYQDAMGAFEWKLPEQLQSDMFVGDMAQWWLSSHPKTDPLFMQIGFPGPHPPFDPSQRFLDMYDGIDIPLPNVTDAELEALPEPYKMVRQHNIDTDHDSLVWKEKPTKAQLRRMWLHYLANTTMIDEKIGEIMASLDKAGYLDNCVVVFMSDHGDQMGHHGQVGKWTLYEETVRVPCLFWSKNPALIADGGRRIEGLVQHFDVAPTILEFAGLEIPEDFAARSLMPVLLNQEWNSREYVFCEQGGDARLKDVLVETMIRSEVWKLVHFMGSDTGQLFDLKADPEELNDLWDSKIHVHIRQGLLDQIRDWHIGLSYTSRNRMEDAR